MSLLETVRVQCPYCWEMIDLVVDCSVGDQEYIEDCEVCCRPIIFQVRMDPHSGPEVVALRDNE